MRACLLCVLCAAFGLLHDSHKQKTASTYVVRVRERAAIASTHEHVACTRTHVHTAAETKAPTRILPPPTTTTATTHPTSHSLNSGVRQHDNQSMKHRSICTYIPHTHTNTTRDCLWKVVVVVVAVVVTLVRPPTPFSLLHNFFGCATNNDDYDYENGVDDVDCPDQPPTHTHTHFCVAKSWVQLRELVARP